MEPEEENELFSKLMDLKNKHRNKSVIGYLNINSFRYKAPDILEILNGKYFDILGIAETKLDESFPDGQFWAENYMMYRRDGVSCSTGGLIVYVSSAITSRRRKDLEPPGHECIVFEQIHNKRKALFYMCYRAPRVDINTYLQELSISMDKALIETDVITVMGDLNQNLLQSSRSMQLRDFMDLFALKNLITTSTCYKNPENHSLVDVLMSSNFEQYCDAGTIANGYSDFHHLIYGVLSQCNIMKKAKTITYRSFKSYDPDRFNQDLISAPFNVGAIFDDVDDKLWYFQTLYTKVLDQHAPVKTKKTRPTQPPFMNERLRKSVHLKAQLRNRYNRFPSRRNWKIFRTQRNRTNHIRRKSIKTYLMEKCSGKNDKTFYQTIKPFISKKAKHAQPTQLQEGNRLINEEKDIANIMNDYYVHIASNIGLPSDVEMFDMSNEMFVDKCVDKFKNHESIVNIKRSVTDPQCFGFECTAVSNTHKLLKSLDVTKSAGYDSIPAKVLNASSNNIVKFVNEIVNDMLIQSCFPGMLKKAEISPLHKKECTLNKVNYRPVSILSSLSKIFEKELETQLRSLSDKVFTSTLSAYRANHSTQHVLLHFTENVKMSLDKKQCVGAVLTDLSKAFDSIPYDLLIAKLDAYNMSRDALVLIASYLRNRLQRVKIGNYRSDWNTLIKGVPQGSILGPVLFNFFVNDLLFPVEEYGIANYADDTTIYAHSPTQSGLNKVLTDATSKVLIWFEQNGMQANPAKFQYIVFGKDNDVQQLKLGRTHLDPSDNVKLLGVNVDSNLEFGKHIDTVCRNAAWQLRALGRLSKYLTTEARITILKSFIVSNLSYCKAVWHFCDERRSNKLESLQKRGLRIALDDYESPYENLLEKAKLSSLRDGRVFTMLTEVYKARKGGTPGYIRDMFQENTTPYNLTRKDQLKIEHKRTTKYGLRTFRHVGAALWNKLPNYVKETEDINYFNKEISNINLKRLM